jgi:plasmid maintenance system antidote protein VapI
VARTAVHPGEILADELAALDMSAAELERLPQRPLPRSI